MGYFETSMSGGARGKRLNGAMKRRFERAMTVRDNLTRHLKMVRNHFGSTYDEFACSLCHAYADIGPAESMGEKYGVENTYIWFFGEKKHGKWLCNGALYTLLNMLYEKQDRFEVSREGRVFFKDFITGAGVKKETFVFVEYEQSTDRYRFTLDPYYEYNW